MTEVLGLDSTIELIGDWENLRKESGKQEFPLKQVKPTL